MATTPSPRAPRRRWRPLKGRMSSGMCGSVERRSEGTFLHWKVDCVEYTL